MQSFYFYDHSSGPIFRATYIITLPKAQIWWSLDYEGTGMYFNTVHIGFCDYIRGLGTNLALTTGRAMTDLFKQPKLFVWTFVKKTTGEKTQNSSPKKSALLLDFLYIYVKITSFMSKTQNSRKNSKLKVKTRKVGTFSISGCRKSVQNSLPYKKG